LKITSSNIIIGNATDVGKIREHNEDYMSHFNTPLGYCIIICDGMGGHAAGDIASQEAIKAIKHYLQDGKATRIETSISLYNAIEFANFKLREMVRLDDSLRGMGTTCIIALINGNKMHVAHAGDSRLYLIRKKAIKQTTKDHSVIQNLIDTGVLTEQEAEHSDKKNQITKAIGIFEKVEPTVTKIPILLAQDDKILLCSDGLTSLVDKKTILDIVSSTRDVQISAMKLIERANFEGGTDNITVQLIEYTGKSFGYRKKFTRKKIIITSIVFLFFSLISYNYLKNINEIKKEKKYTKNRNDTINHLRVNKELDLTTEIYNSEKLIEDLLTKYPYEINNNQNNSDKK
jgi:protein phosphatase